jgi:hypothetical protein
VPARSDALRDSGSLVFRPDLLLKSLQEEGYVYVPGYIPPNLLTPLRDEFMRIAHEGQWLQPGTPTDHAIANPRAACGPPEPAFMDVHGRMFKSERLHRFPHDPLFTGLFAHLLNDQPLLHPQIRIRLRFPNFDCTTPPHQDHFVTRGTPETFTVWVPLTDCPAEMGGLQVLSASHRLGLLPARQDLSAGTLEITCPLLDEWIGHDYAAGDVLIFHSLTVHRALPNLSKRLRVSIDFRFQRLSDPVDPERFVPPHGFDSWDTLYEGWESHGLRHYWRSSHLNCSPSIACLRQLAATDHAESAAARELLRHL